MITTILYIVIAIGVAIVTHMCAYSKGYTDGFEAAEDMFYAIEEFEEEKKDDIHN